MKLTSPSFKHEEEIPEKYTCKGENISPSLKFVDIPENCKSLALIMEDPDAPFINFTHWTIWNIPSDKKRFSEGEKIEYPQGQNSYRKNSYMGPCPPFGRHRYFFRLYALDTFIDLFIDTKKKKLKRKIENHIIDEAELMGTFKK